MRRRDLIAMLGGALAWPRAAAAQSIARRPLIGVLFPVPEDIARPSLTAIRGRLGELGFLVGRDVDLATRYATTPDRDTALLLGAELLALSPAVIVMGAPSDMILALKQLTSTVPVIFVNMTQDPVTLGIAQSIAHPGGNFTGFMFSSNAAIVGKQLGLLKEMAPSVARVDALLGAYDEATARTIPDAARKLNLALRTFSVARAEEIAPIIAGTKGNADAVFVGNGPLFNRMREEIASMVLQARLPLISTVRELSAAGGLMSYGSSTRRNYAAAVDYVTKILWGARAADLPIQQAAIYEFVINTTTAKALGLKIPPTLLAIADEVIE